MSAHRSLHLAWSALAVGLALGLAGCDEPPPPSPMALMQAASSADGDGQQARAAFAGGSLREQMQLYFGERFTEDQGSEARQPQAQSEGPAF